MSDLVPIPKRGAPDSPHLSRDIPSAFVPISQLLPYARNARTHSDAQVAQIAASIVEWGWTNPILADAKGIVAGHGRLAAARLLYGQGRVLHLPSGEDVPAGCVPCIDVSGWSDTARRAYVLADNQLALQAGWDDAMLAEELRSIRDDGFDIDIIGFGDDEVGKLFAQDADETLAGIDHDNAPRRVARGDVWRLGAHMLACGDSFDDAVVARVLAGDAIDVVVLDPPFDDTADANWTKFVHDPCVVFGTLRMMMQLPIDLVRFERVLYKRAQHNMISTQLRMQHCIIAQLGSVKFCPPNATTYFSFVKQDKIDRLGAEDEQNNIGTANRQDKPVGVVIEHLTAWVDPAWRVVFDPFAGRGVTVFAAQELRKSARCIELDARKCDAILHAWEQLTGETAHKVAS